ncbi:hypothetical protein [Nocardiopsis sp. LOL_012]|uniref:hypothetical protein n=1 Tax=Nocardiopsis sp. LOL_012 TaxID=3345409 RepID=UPI003A855352
MNRRHIARALFAGFAVPALAFGVPSTAMADTASSSSSYHQICHKHDYFRYHCHVYGYGSYYVSSVGHDGDHGGKYGDKGGHHDGDRGDGHGKRGGDGY